MGVALASAVVAVTPVLDVSRTEGWRVWALTTLHAGTLLGLVLLRVSWLRLAAARVLTAPRA